MKIVVYTALFGDIDPLWSVCPKARGEAEHVCYTGTQLQEVGLWGGSDKPEMLPGTEKTPGIPTWRFEHYDGAGMTYRRKARRVKTMIHELEPEADIWIWLDANVRLLIPPEEAVRRWLGDGDLAIFNHPDRKCLYSEARFCAQKGKDASATLEAQAKWYKKQGMPVDWGLAETRCVIQRNTDAMCDLGDRWWHEIEKRSVRDQVSLPFICWKMGIRWSVIPGRAWVKSTNDAFWFRRHTRGKA